MDGSRQLKIECKMALEEVKYYARSEHFKKCFIKPGDVQYLCNFAESPTNTTAINELFTISSDSTWGEGYSMGSLEASSALNSGLYDLLQRKFNVNGQFVSHNDQKNCCNTALFYRLIDQKTETLF